MYISPWVYFLYIPLCIKCPTFMFVLLHMHVSSVCFLRVYASSSACPSKCIVYMSLCVYVLSSCGCGLIAADGLLVSWLVAVDLLLWIGRCGLAADCYLWVGCCGLVVVGQSLWISCCGSVAVGRSLWGSHCGLVALGCMFLPCVYPFRYMSLSGMLPCVYAAPCAFFFNIHAHSSACPFHVHVSFICMCPHMYIPPCVCLLCVCCSMLHVPLRCIFSPRVCSLHVHVLPSVCPFKCMLLRVYVLFVCGCGMAVVGWSLWVCRCGSVAVGRLPWVGGRGSVAVGRLL